MPEIFAVIYLKFKEAKPEGYFVLMVQVKTLIRLLLEEQPDLGLHCLQVKMTLVAWYLLMVYSKALLHTSN